MVKSIGAWSEAATVCPASTVRLMTMPSIGETMVAFFRLVSSAARSAAAAWTSALATATPASARR